MRLIRMGVLLEAQRSERQLLGGSRGAGIAAELCSRRQTRLRSADNSGGISAGGSAERHQSIKAGIEYRTYRIGTTRGFDNSRSISNC